MSQISYKTINNHNFMLLPCQEEGRNIETQISMLTSSNIASFLPVTVTSKNGMRILQYNITSLTRLSGILERSKLTTQQFFDLLSGVVTAMERCQEYALSPCGVCLDNDLIYVNTQSFAPQFVYRPTMRDDEPFQVCVRWIQGLIASGWVVVDSSINQVLDAVTASGFTISTLKRIVQNPQGAPPRPVQVQTVQPPQLRPEPPAAQPARQPSPGEPAPAPPPQIKAPNKSGLVPPAVGKQAKADKGKTSPTSPKGGGTGSYPAKNVVLSVLLVALSLALVIGGLLSDVTKLPDGGVDIAKAGGIVILLVALDGMLLRKWLGKDQKISSGQPERNAAERSKKGRPTPVMSAPGAGIAPPAGPAAAPVPAPVHRPAPTPVAPPRSVAPGPVAPAPEPEESDLTVMLESSAGYFLRGSDGQEIPLRFSPFRVGRDAAAVDQVVSDPTVGRYHAQFVQTDDGWTVIDNNSRNHTYLNGVCLDPNTSYPLRNGDAIRLAKASFVFEYR